jgi:DNA-binding XRE family transcriptional regulator
VLRSVSVPHFGFSGRAGQYYGRTSCFFLISPLLSIADLSFKAYSHNRQVSSKPNDVCVRFGKRLRALRKKNQWTQVYMAEYVGMDRSFISDLENGKKEICIRNLELLATTFDMTISKLMSRL